MAQRNRQWRWIKMAGLVSSLTIAAAFLLSLVSPQNFTPRTGTHVSISHGSISITTVPRALLNAPPPAPAAPGTVVLSSAFIPHRTWWISVSNFAGIRTVIVALWIPFALCALPTAYAFYRSRRRPPGHCPKCGYNLIGIPAAVCPECGATISRQPAPQNTALKS